MKTKFTSLLALALLVANAAMAQSFSVTMTEPGSLADSIPADNHYTMTGLTISGPINGDDVRFLRDVMSVETYGGTPKGRLTSLNLKDARIVPGGAPYYEGVDGSNRPVSYSTRQDTIGSRMFYNCSKLRTVQMPETVVYLDSFCFFNTALVTVRMPERVKGIGLGAFQQCRSLTTFVPNEACESYGLLSFYHCDKLKRFEFPNGVKKLGDAMFNYCDALTYVKLPESIEELPMMLFENTHALTTIVMPTELKHIGERAFMYCSSITSLALPEGLETIGSYAFAGCSNLSRCTIPSTVREVGPLSYIGQWKMNGIQVHPDNPYLMSEEGSLYSKDGSVMYQFFNGWGLDSLVVPETVQEIAYEGCGYSYDLKHIVLPESLLLIGSMGIDFCYFLEDIICKAQTPPDCVGRAIDPQIVSQATLYVPRASLADYRKAPVWKDFKTIKPIPDGGDDTGINTPSTSAQGPAAIYDLSGRRMKAAGAGISIVRESDGTVRKVYNVKR